MAGLFKSMAANKKSDDAAQVDERTREVAINRLRLQACRERRELLEAQLEARRLTAELAQQKLKELKRREQVVQEMGAAKGPVDRKAFIQEEEPVEQYEPAAGDYRLIDERLSQLAKQRDGQALERKEKIRGFNDQRFLLLQEEQRLAAERMRLVQDMENERQRMAEETASVLRDLDGVEPDMEIPDPTVTRTQPAGITVDGLHGTVRKIGLGMPSSKQKVSQLKEEWFDYLLESKQPGEDPPELNPNLGLKHLVNSEDLSADEQHMRALEHTIHARMYEECLRKAMMSIVREVGHEVVSLVAGDIASEAVFSRYWAEKTASKIILMSLDSPKLLREEPQALVQIMREFSQKRFQKAFVHVHTLTSKNAAIKVEESEEKGKKREDLDTEVQEEIEVLTLFSDLRVSSVDPAAIERERDFWSKCRLIPIFIKTSKNIGLAEIAPNSNLLAVCPVGSGLIIYDIRHLPPQPCRTESTKTQVVALAWSDDSSQVAIVEKSGLTSLYSLRMDKHVKPVIDSAGAFAPCKLTPLGTFEPVVDKKGTVLAGELEDLLDVSDPPAWHPESVAFAPSITLTGTQPTVMLGLKGGTVVRHNTPHVKMSCYGKTAAHPPTKVKYAVRRDLNKYPAREFLVHHRASVLYLGSGGDGRTLVTVDSDAIICTWVYSTEHFSSLGWFLPEKVRKINVSDFVLQEDPGFKPTIYFPPPDQPKVKKDALNELRKQHYVEMAKMGIRGGQPMSYGEWIDDTGGVGRFEVRCSDDSTDERMIQHMCRFDQAGLLQYHRVARVSMMPIEGAPLKVKVDYSKKFLVVLGLIPSGAGRVGMLCIFRLDLEKFTLTGPRINIPLPMEIEKRYQKLGLSGDPAVDYDDIDFDVVPPLEQTGTQTLILLMVNLVHFYGLETGQELRVPFDPLAVQQKKVLLDAVRVCGTFRRLPEGGVSSEAMYHQIVITSAQSSTVYLFTVQIVKNRRASVLASGQGRQTLRRGSVFAADAVERDQQRASYSPDPSEGSNA